MSGRSGPYARPRNPGRAVADERAALHQVDERRHRIRWRALQPGDDRAHRRPAADRREALFVVPRLHLECVVSPFRPDERPNKRNLPGRLSEPGHQLANRESRDRRRNRLELTAHLQRGIGLQVDHVEVRRATVEMNVDHRLVGRSNPRPSLGRKQIRQTEPRRPQSPREGTRAG